MTDLAEFRALVMRGRPKVKSRAKDREAQATVGDVTVEHLQIDVLPAADITLDVSQARLGFRDSLTLMGRDRWVTSYPHIAGSEFVGTVVDSNDDRFSVGNRVFAAGHGLGERYWGGFAQRVRLIGDWLSPVPQGLSSAAMVRAGLPAVTAQLALDALVDEGLTPDKGPVLITHLASEVGMAALQILRHHRFDVAVACDDEELAEAVKGVGVKTVVSHTRLLERSGPVLGQQNWSAVIDSAGGNILAAAMSELHQGGAAVVTAPSIGHDLPGDLSPFVVRGCRLIGVNAQNLTMETRQDVWQRLAPVLSKTQDEATDAFFASREVRLEEVPEIAAQLLQGNVRGQAIVDLAN